jgi:hypothetical protein
MMNTGELLRIAKNLRDASLSFSTDRVRTGAVRAAMDLENLVQEAAETVPATEPKPVSQLIEEMFGRSVNKDSELYKLIAEKED